LDRLADDGALFQMDEDLVLDGGASASPTTGGDSVAHGGWLEVRHLVRMHARASARVTPRVASSSSPPGHHPANVVFGFCCSRSARAKTLSPSQ
jgi:hypothetical protein